MRFLFRRAVFVFAILFLIDGAAAKTYTLKTSSSKFRVVDGDSVNYGKLKFRLCGIQAPEYDMPRYDYATQMLKRLLGQGLVLAHVVDIDKYKRKVVVMFTGGHISVNEKMVQLGGAKHYKRFSANCEPLIAITRFNAAEKRARRHRHGIWKGH